MSIRQSFKSYLRKFIAWVFYYSGLYRLFHKGKVRILMYHRILKDSDKTIFSIQPGMYVTESTFEMQMAYLAKHYHIISLRELLALWKDGGFSKNKKYCIVTFDDGWIDNYLNAYPILNKYNIPATIFLTTSFIGTNRWFWPEKLTNLLLTNYQNVLDMRDDLEEENVVISSIYTTINENRDFMIREQIDFTIEALKKYPEQIIENALDRIYKLLDISIPMERVLLNWDEAKEMSSHGISFGSHTCNHKILTGLSLNEVRKELEESMQQLKDKDLDFIPVFCYPNGNYNKKIQKSVRDCGYVAAVTTKFGFENMIPNNYYGIKRIGVHNDISSTEPLFSFHLSGLRHRI